MDTSIIILISVMGTGVASLSAVSIQAITGRNSTGTRCTIFMGTRRPAVVGKFLFQTEIIKERECRS